MNRTTAALLAAAALTLSACAQADDDPADAASATTSATSPDSSTAASSATTGEPASDAVVVPITIADGSADPQGGRVEVAPGQQVVLKVTSDAADELHVHSEPEHEFEVRAGDDGTEFELTIDRPGQVAVELHHLDVTVVQLVVR